MPAAAVQKITYGGVHHYAVDANRRVQMPSHWRTAKPIEFTIILWPQHQAGPCLRVLSSEELEKLRAKIEMLPATEKTSLKRHIGSNSEQIKLDGANRLGIPENLFTKAGIRDGVAFVGMLDYFEIWSKDLYKAMDAVEQPVVVRGLKLLE